MTNNEFFEEVRKNILDYLPKELGDNMSAEINQVYKTNDVCLHGLSITSNDMRKQKAVPSIYLEEYLEDFNKGRSMESIMKELTERYVEAEKTSPEIKGVSLKYADVKDKIVFQVVEMKRNKNRLKDLEYTPLGNGLAMTYQIVMTSNEQGIAGININRSMAQQFGYDKGKLYEDAMRNSQELRPATLIDMGQMMEAMARGEVANSPLLDDNVKYDRESQMLILSNDKSLNGATVLFYPGVQEQVARAIDDSYYVLPSSIHEVLIVPESAGVPVSQLQATVKEVNEQELLPKDILSDRVFRYDKDTKELSQVPENNREKDMTKGRASAGAMREQCMER